MALRYKGLLGGERKGKDFRRKNQKPNLKEEIRNKLVQKMEKQCELVNR